MKYVLVVAAALLFSTSAMAERVWELNTGKHVQVLPHRNRAAKHGGGGANNVSYHNGPVLHQAKVVPVFWGSSATWGTNGAPSALAQTLVNFFTQFGTNAEYNVITQYYDFGGSVQLTSLTSRYWIDNSTPPTNVTDAALQGEVVKAIGQVGLDTSTVYEVFLPPTSYASFSVYDSCGGKPDLLRVPRELRLRRRGRQVRLDAVSELRGLPVVRLDGGAELPALRLPRDARGGDRSRRQRVVRPPGQRSGRQVRLVPVALPRERLRLPVRVVEPRPGLRPEPLSA